MQPTLLIYHFSAKRAAKLRMLTMRLGIRVRTVETQEYLTPIRVLVQPHEVQAERYDGAGFSEELLVMAYFSQALLDTFLRQLRAAMPPVALKCVLTDTNAHWNSLQLRDELVAEHAAMQRGAQQHPTE